MSERPERTTQRTGALTVGLLVAVLVLSGTIATVTIQQQQTAQKAAQTHTQTVKETVTQTLTQTVTASPIVAATPTPVATPSPTPTPKVTGKPKVLRIGISTFGANFLDPTICSTSFCAQVNMQIYERLLDYDPKAKDFINLKPRLAESMDVSPDGLTYTFKLKKGVLFHTGTELTADTVVFTVKRMTAANLTLPFFPGKQPYTGQYGPFIDENSAKAIDKYTVEIKIKKPNSVFPIHMGGILTPYASILDPVLMKNAKKVLNGTDWGAQWLIDGHDVGTGPYFIKDFVPDQRLVLGAYPLYWQGKPAIDEVHYIVVKDSNVQALMVARGDLHLALDFGVEQVATVQGNPNVKLLTAPEAAYFGINFNFNRTNSKEPLRNLKVRQAIAYLIDWESILKEIMKGAGAPMYGIFPKGMPGWDAFGGAPLYKYNLDKAKQLMTEAGYPNGFPQKLKFLHYEHGLAGVPFQDIALLIRDSLGKVGIQVELETGPVAVVESKWRGGEFDLMTAFSSFRYNDPDGPILSVLTVHWPQGGLKWSFADQLKDEGVRAVDPAKRAEIYKRFQTEVYAKVLPSYSYLQWGSWKAVSNKIVSYYFPEPLSTFHIQFYYMDLEE